MSDSPKLPFTLPAEWAPHETTLLTWPHNASDWPGKLESVRTMYCELVRILSRFEPVTVLCQTPTLMNRVQQELQEAHVDMEAVTLRQIITNRSWIRDYGPISVYDTTGEARFLNFTFNGWARFPAHEDDNAVSAQLSTPLDRPMTTVKTRGQPVVLEGGSIDSNGEGLLLTTRECLLSATRQRRNPHLSQDDLEGLFAQIFGTRQTLWLGKGIEGDDTHGHVDDITRFTGPRTILTMTEDHTEDPNHEALAENFHYLKERSGCTIVPLPMPSPLYHRGSRLPASYANFLIANNCVLVPTFNDPADRNALGVIQDLFPKRTVIGIHAVDLLAGLGGLHCISMQVPAKRL